MQEPRKCKGLTLRLSGGLWRAALYVEGEPKMALHTWDHWSEEQAILHARNAAGQLRWEIEGEFEREEP